MQVKLFTIPITNITEQEKALNSFLSTNKITEFEKKLVQTETQAFWCIYINYEKKAETATFTAKSIRKKIDYKSVLSVEEFNKFEKLRAIRKTIAQQAAISAYVVATDAELSQIIKLPEITEANLKKITGFGDKKAKKYGKLIVEYYNSQKTTK